LTKLITGDAPGLDLVIYGGLLVLIIAFAPRGIAGLLADLRLRFARLRSSLPGRAHG
jgi:branched-chain amino acid transport system permease protein